MKTQRTTKPAGQTIIIAWLRKDGMRPTGQQERFDGVNYRTQYEAAWQARAVRWANAARPGDWEKAEAHAATMDEPVVKVLAFPASEKDPQGQAKSALLATVPTHERATL